MTKPKLVHVRATHIAGYGWAWFKADGPDDPNPEGKTHGPFDSKAACEDRVRSTLGADYQGRAQGGRSRNEWGHHRQWVETYRSIRFVPLQC